MFNEINQDCLLKPNESWTGNPTKGSNFHQHTLIHKCSTSICFQFYCKEAAFVSTKEDSFAYKVEDCTPLQCCTSGGFSFWLWTINIAHILCHQCTKERYKLADTSWAVNAGKSQPLSHKTTGLSVSTRAVVDMSACSMQVIDFSAWNPMGFFIFTVMS